MRLYNGRYVGTCSNEWVHYTIYLSFSLYRPFFSSFSFFQFPKHSSVKVILRARHLSFNNGGFCISKMASQCFFFVAIASGFTHWWRIHGYFTDLSAQVSLRFCFLFSVVSFFLSVLVFEAELLCFCRFCFFALSYIVWFSQNESRKKKENNGK